MINFNSPDGFKIKQYLLEQIDEDVDELKNPNLDDKRTQFIRGRIYMAEAILELENNPEELEA